ncbi:MAG: DMT family transporter [Micrococcales bacterium]|nr:DMT family transporter [Micrococcales bacterium]
MRLPRPGVAARRGHALEATATGVLLVVTVAWGTTFLVVKNATEHMPVLAFLGVRFALATVVMVIARPRAVLRLSREQRWHGIVIGLVLGAAYVTQTFGLQHTSSSISGFLTGMFLVFTPLLSWLVLRKRVPASTWLAIGIAAGGLALISLQGFGFGIGEALTLACAALFAVQLLFLETWSRRADAYGLTVIQLAVVAVGCLVAAPFHGGLVLPSRASDWWAVLFCALGATAFAFFGQTWAQSILSAFRCAVIMTMEPVFAGLTGVLLGGDDMNLRLGLGAACIVGAMLLLELGVRRAADGAVPIDH